jgi:hypothetical protein
MDDEPPPYATQAPKVFDNALPEVFSFSVRNFHNFNYFIYQLTSDDVALLKQKLPELASAVPEYSESSFNFLFSTNLLRSNITEQVSPI